MNYQIIRSRRRSMCIMIKDGEVVVKAPPLVPKVLINRFVLSKSDWINKHLTNPKVRFKRQYKEGEKFLVLGREHILKIIKTILKKPEIKLEGKNLVILTYDDSKKFLRLQVEKFYSEKTRQIVRRTIQKYEPSYSGKILFKAYKSKWGSCTGKNDLSFNVKLAMTPIEVIEYVVIHELAHFHQKNHSRHFWSLVSSADKEYNSKRKWLRANNDKLVL